MKKHLLPVFLGLLLPSLNILYAQCYIDGITFSSQAQIDAFPAEHAGCTEIVVEGDLVIQEDIEGDIVSLDSLYSIMVIEGNLSIGEYITTGPGNISLVSLNGLNNLASIGGNLYVSYNDALISLSGLDNVTSIGNSIWLADNQALESLNGLESLSSLGGSLAIGYWGLDYYGMLELHGNPSLTSIAALQGLDTIGGDYLFIIDNDQLETLAGLNNIQYLGINSPYPDLWIVDNEVLNSIEGLENLTFFNLAENEDFNFRIFDNPNLSVCNIYAVCGMAQFTDNQLYINDNAPGCNTSQEVEFSCEPCLQGGTTFTSQAQLDSFVFDYPGCRVIQGDVLIQEAIENDITDFGTFWLVSSIQGSFSIEGNNAIEELGFSPLSSIDGNLNIQYNGLLTSLSFLDNLDHSTINTVILQGNPNLSTCNIQPICDYLENGGPATIENNAPGCNSQQEVEDACLTVSVDDLITDDAIQIFPNPTSGIIQVSTFDNSEWKVLVRDATGTLVISNQQLLNGQIDLSNVPTGLYLLELNNGLQTFTKRIVKQ